MNLPYDNRNLLSYQRVYLDFAREKDGEMRAERREFDELGFCNDGLCELGYLTSRRP